MIGYDTTFFTGDDDWQMVTTALNEGRIILTETPGLWTLGTQVQVRGRVPPYVFQTQAQYVECPSCHRIYWKGTHWQDMMRKLEKLKGE